MILRLVRLILFGFLMLTACSVASAQTDPGTGTPAFGTFNRDAIDTINMGNLNVHFQFPIFVKKGRVIDFVATITSENTPYRPRFNNNQFFWQQSLNPNSSWSISAPLIDSLQQAGANFTPPNCNGPGLPPQPVVYDNFFYTDTNNTVHSFGPSPVGYPSACFSPQSNSGFSLDGYRVDVAVDGTTGTFTTKKVTDPAGNVRDFIAGTLTDPNGIQISGGFGGNFTWTDTTSNPVLKETATTSPQTWNYPNPSLGGLSEPVVLTISTLNIKTNFQCPNIPDLPTQIGPATVSLTTGIALPDGTSYSIAYESTNGTYPSTTVTGRIHSLTLPSGATITYTYSGGTNGINCDDGSPAVLTKQSPDGIWTYNHSFTSTGIGQGYWTTIVTDPSLNDTVYTFGSIAQTQSVNGQAITGSAGNTYEDQRLIYQGSHTSGTLLETILTCYNGNFTNCATSSNELGNLPIHVTQKDVYTYLPGIAQPSLSETFYNVFGLVTQDNEFNYGVNTGAAPTVAPLKATTLVYANVGGNIQNRPACVQVTTGTSPTTCGTVTSTTNSITKYSNYDSHGNVGTIQNWVSGNTYLSRGFTYLSTGLVQTATDFKQTPTTYTYGDCNNSYPTQITKSVLSQFMTWDCNGGVITSTTDPNSQTSQYNHNDPFWRVRQVTYPDGGNITTTYNDSASPANVTSDQPIDNLGHALTTQTNFDTLGRPTQTILTSDPDGTTYAVTVYDTLGRPGKVYNPTRCNPPTTNCGEPTWGFTGYAYDALNRLTTVTAQDGGVTHYLYSGNCTTITDPASKARKSCSDALGRLSQVFEDPAGQNDETDYTYNALDDLLSVNQKGGSTISTNWRTRNFTYDGLSRLTSSTNPESNTEPVSPFTVVANTYTYDPNGNLTYKTAPAPNQQANSTVTLSYCYDVLDRLTAKAYTQQTCTNGTLPNPVASYAYDQGPSAANPIGRRTGMTDAAGSATWTYDVMGRPATQLRTTNGTIAATVYTYNLDGSIATLTYPTGSTVTYITGSAGRPLSAVDQDNSINYAQGASYTPQGALSSLLLGQTASFAGINLNQGYNARLGPASIRGWSTTGVALDVSYSTFANGTVSQIVNNRDATRTQNFTYDSLNRLFTAQTAAVKSNSGPAGCWAETYTYDPWGNLYSFGANSATQSAYTGCSQESGLSSSATIANRLSTNGYDTAGNLTSTPGAGSFSYDAENHLLSAAGVNYTYDGDGNRVQKSSGTTYWYGVDGNVLDQFPITNGNLEYVFFDGRRIAQKEFVGGGCSNNPEFYFSDHLGSARVVTDSSGNVLDDSDFYPFGGERQIVSTSGNTFKFTGKERDSESGLDNFGARYNASTMGRFMSPDPENAGADPGAPQSWNAYSYVGNNPLKYVDPSGLDCIYLNEGGDQVQEVKPGDCRSETDPGYYVNGTVNGGVNGVTLSDDQNLIVYSYTNEDQPGTQYGQQCVGDCSNYSTTVSSSTTTIGASNAAPPQWTIGPGTNWFHSTQARCIGSGLTAAGKDVAMFDEFHAIADSIADASLVPLKGLLTAGTAVQGAEKVAEHLAENHAAQVAIKGALRSQGVKVSASAVGKRAAIFGKGAGIIGLALTAKTGYDAYNACTQD